jgi:hypothetical protein
MSDQEPLESPYLTVNQLAKRWHKTPNAIRIMRHRRQGPDSFKHRGRVLFEWVVVLAYEEAQMTSDSRTNSDLDPTRFVPEPRLYAPQKRKTATAA